MDAHRNLGGLRLFCEKRGGGGGGGFGVAGRFWGGGGGGWHKRKNLQISDVQRLASLLPLTVTKIKNNFNQLN